MKLSEKIEKILQQNDLSLDKVVPPSFGIKNAFDYLHAYLHGDMDAYRNYRYLWDVNNAWWEGHMRDILEEVKKLEGQEKPNSWKIKYIEIS